MIGGKPTMTCTPAPPHTFGVDWIDRRNKDFRKYYDLPTDPVTGKHEHVPRYRPLRRTNFKGKGQMEYCWKTSSGNKLPKEVLSKRQQEKIKKAVNLTSCRGEHLHQIM